MTVNNENTYGCNIMSLANAMYTAGRHHMTCREYDEMIKNILDSAFDGMSACLYSENNPIGNHLLCGSISSLLFDRTVRCGIITSEMSCAEFIITLLPHVGNVEKKSIIDGTCTHEDWCEIVQNLTFIKRVLHSFYAFHPRYTIEQFKISVQAAIDYKPDILILYNVSMTNYRLLSPEALTWLRKEISVPYLAIQMVPYYPKLHGYLNSFIMSVYANCISNNNQENIYLVYETRTEEENDSGLIIRPLHTVIGDQ